MMIKCILLYVDNVDASTEVKTTIEEIGNEGNFPSVEFEEIDILKNNTISYIGKYSINSVPALLILNDDALLYKITGNVPKQDMERLLSISLEKAKS